MKNKIKLLILDVDGILTDGKKIYGLDGLPIAKIFCDKDFTAIKRFKSIGIPVVFLTGDKKVNEEIGINRNIPVYLSKGLEKSDFVNAFEKEYECNREEMCYVGDDLFDIGIMKIVGFKYCTSDSPRIVRDHCQVLKVKGGENVISYLFDHLEQTGIIDSLDFESTMKKINFFDAKEIF